MMMVRWKRRRRKKKEKEEEEKEEEKKEKEEKEEKVRRRRKKKKRRGKKKRGKRRKGRGKRETDIVAVMTAGSSISPQHVVSHAAPLLVVDAGTPQLRTDRLVGVWWVFGGLYGWCLAGNLMCYLVGVCGCLVSIWWVVRGWDVGWGCCSEGVGCWLEEMMITI